MIGIIVPANIKFIPYISYYINILEKNNEPYEIVSWNRLSLDEKVDHHFDWHCEESNRKKMLLGYFLFSRYVRKLLKKRKYNKVIVLTFAPAFFFGPGFINEYKNRFILDIRDDSPIIRYFEKRFRYICSCASTIVVSSPVYGKWTQRDYILSHNADREVIKENLSNTPQKLGTESVTMVCAGMMLEEDINIDLIKSIQNRNDIQFYYAGRENLGKRKIIDFCMSNQINNVKFIGEYKKDDILRIYRDNGNLVNILRKNTKINAEAIPNKMYDSIISGVPFAVFKHNVAVSTIAENYNLGIVVPDNIEIENVVTYIENEFEKFDFSSYMVGREKFLKKVLEDSDRFENSIREFIIR